MKPEEVGAYDSRMRRDAANAQAERDWLDSGASLPKHPDYQGAVNHNGRVTECESCGQPSEGTWCPKCIREDGPWIPGRDLLRRGV